MDIKCRNCGEPWDAECLHEEVSERWPNEPWKKNGRHDQTEYEKYYNKVRDEFYTKGCATFSYGKCSDYEYENGDIVGALYDEFGHDFDGVTAEIEDFGL